MAGRVLTDFVSLGVLASRVPRDAVDDAVAATGKGARRRGGKLPPHVVVYLVMALALFADEDYEEVVERLTGALRAWGCWDERWEPPTKGAVTQARQRLGPEPMAELFSQVAGRAGPGHGGAFLGPWRLMWIDGTELDVPDTPANREAFGPGRTTAPFPKVRLVTVCECGSRAPVLAAMGPSAAKGSGEQSLARTLYPRLEEGWLLLADRLFYGWDDWCAAAGSGADLLWRVKDGPAAARPWSCCPTAPAGRSWSSRRSTGSRREALIEAARRGEDLDPALARHVRVIEYEVPDRDGDGKDELIALVTTITDWRAAPAAALAGAYHQRWEHETANAQLKTILRGPGKDPALRQPGPGRAGNLGLPPDRLRHQRPDLRRRHRRRDRPRPGQASPRTVRVVRRAVGPAFPPSPG